MVIVVVEVKTAADAFYIILVVVIVMSMKQVDLRLLCGITVGVERLSAPVWVYILGLIGMDMGSNSRSDRLDYCTCFEIIFSERQESSVACVCVCLRSCCRYWMQRLMIFCH